MPIFLGIYSRPHGCGLKIEKYVKIIEKPEFELLNLMHVELHVNTLIKL